MTDAPSAETATFTTVSPGRAMRRSFWLLLAVVAVCIVAGVALALWATERWGRPAGLASAPATATEARLRDRIAELERQLAQAQAGPAPSPAGAYDPDATAALDARLRRLEAAQARTARAASAAVAAAALEEASQTGRPFTGELDAFQALAPDPGLVASLAPIARTGAPTRAALAEEFDRLAARAANAARAPSQDSSFLTRAVHALGSLATLRRVDDTDGAGVDAVLARAERRMADGDLEGALRDLDALPSGGREALAAWREKAARRVELERRIADLRTAALRDLAAGSAAAPAEGARP